MACWFRKGRFHTQKPFRFKVDLKPEQWFTLGAPKWLDTKQWGYREKYYGSDIGGHIWLEPAIAEWINANSNSFEAYFVGRVLLNGRRAPEPLQNTKVVEGQLRYVITFKRKREAALFKLFWC